MEFIDILNKAVWSSIVIHEHRLINISNGYQIEVSLDNLDDPTGAVRLEDCEEYSKRIVDLIDNAIETDDSELTEALPEGMTTENYSLEVSSAGAERRLKIPEDLERFRDRPLRLKVLVDQTRHRLHVLFREMKKTDDGSLLFEFEDYRSGKSGSGKQKKSKKKASSLFDEDGKIRIRETDLLEANLFLDF